MLKLLKFMGLAIGLTLVAITLGGVKSTTLRATCHLTDVLGGDPTCDSNVQWE